jgi:hypothetical protein
MGRAVRDFPVLLGGVVAAVFLTGLAGGAGPPLTLVDPQWQPKADSQGVSWMIDPQSNLRINGGQSMLLSAGVATVNGAQFMPNRTQMTPDGGEYVFEGNPNANNPFGNAGPALTSTRRIKLDVQTATVRFVESIQNPNPAPMQVSLSMGSTVRSFLQSVVCGPSGTALSTATGQPLGNQLLSRPVPYRSAGATVHLAIPEHDCGFVLPSSAGRYPAVLFCVPESAGVKPSVDIQSSRTIQVSFSLTVPAQSTVSVVWGLAQRNLPANLDAAEMRNQLKAFQDRQWLADLPEDVAKSIVNYRRSNAGAKAAMGNLLQPVLDLASHYRLERGKDDVLVQDEQIQLRGVVAGSNLTIETPQGKTAVPLGEVALLCGGAGAERPMRVYLRNGEILAGRVEAKDLVLKAQGGVEAKLPPETLHLLFLHAAPEDGKAAAEALSMVETSDGQRLSLSGSDAQLHAATPWGGLDVGLAEIDRLTARREPQPVYHLTLDDGSRLAVLLPGEFPALKSPRFGPLKLSAAGVRQLWTLKRPVATQDSEQEEPALPAGPHCRLVGANVLAGTIESPKVNLATAGGVLGVPVDRIQDAQRSGDPQAGGSLDIQLTDGRHLSGRLAHRTVALRFHGKVWEVPAQHLIGISGKKPAAAESSPDASTARAAGATSAPNAAKPNPAREAVVPQIGPPPTTFAPTPTPPATSVPAPPANVAPAPPATVAPPTGVAPLPPAGIPLPAPVLPPPQVVPAMPPDQALPPATVPVEPLLPAPDDDDDNPFG